LCSTGHDLDIVQFAKQLIEKVATKTGLNVITAYVLTEQPAKAWWVRIMNYSPDTSHKTR